MLLSFAKRDESDPESDPLIHPSDEAFLLLAWINSYTQWVYKASSGTNFEKDHPDAKSKYSSNVDGSKAWGQWSPAGIRLCLEATEKITKQRLPHEELDEPEAIVNFIKDVETQALARIRNTHNITEDGPTKKKKKRLGKLNEFEDDECDMDDDEF